ncbi:hypothetical protein, conserved [Trypanosoma brucei gambiense DAL972]|uniref:N-acetyltransferase domain-containing protein n=3 Tax=Trypanosoma brucei TaxID=5691 RepID=D0A374_TRYB9|nr:hypothetical protein, conserved [Trypanosoma brucei gambiense DAL972]RHW68954.1 hypothetical protein DPX39_100072000 [Trypanosoma brucei equiperdum]CBH15718.1 hypothetical protein, conserved [Trypanosoma brucei gambiense DAL972]|eukprot:XP_011777982.1 hypothetical protein, conserved [Trypanosoma brucei gambiense DAL972]
MLLSDEHLALLAKYYATVEFTGEQKDALIEKYWEANEAERKAIARAYASLFANDADFIQRLLAHYDMHVSPHMSQGASSCNENGEPCKSEAELSAGAPAEQDGNGSNNGSLPARPAKPSKGPSGQQLTYSQLVLRTAIQDQYSKLSGDGPFPMAFGLVLSEEERREVIDLYSLQFQYPDQPELQRLVILPQTHSTRTRRRAKGSYTWYLRSLNTNEMVCAVTIMAHHYETHHFVEVPLFATGVGYKKHGFGRLMNAALLQWCVETGFEFVMISADVKAIPFWSHLGYKTMEKSELTRIVFYYEHNCYKFKGAEVMIRYCRTWPTDGVKEALARVQKVIVSGHVGLMDA